MGQKWFARTCSVCGEGMNEGFCDESTSGYYCSLPCRRSEFTDEEWNDRYDDGDGDCYWTDWTDDPDAFDTDDDTITDEEEQ